MQYITQHLLDTIQLSNGHQIVNLYDATGRKYKTVNYINMRTVNTDYDEIAYYTYDTDSVKYQVTEFSNKYNFRIMKNKSLALLLGLGMAVSVIGAELNEPTDKYFAEGMKWVSGTLSGGECEGSVDRCTLQGDTIIDGKTYHKILHQHNPTEWVWEKQSNKMYEYLVAPTISRTVPIAVDGQKIYARYMDTDLLIYDFSLEVGDSISMYGFDYYSDYFELSRYYAYVKATDSITLLDGRRVKRLRYDWSSRMPDIEYVGSEYGILSPLIMTGIPTCGHSCSCFSQNGEHIYETWSGDCSTLDEVIYEMETSAPVVRDDRFLLSLSDNILHIQTSDELSQVKIYTLNGQCVLQTSQTDIDVSALPQGMYILHASTTDGMEKQAKFLAQ